MTGTRAQSSRVRWGVSEDESREVVRGQITNPVLQIYDLELWVILKRFKKLHAI